MLSKESIRKDFSDKIYPSMVIRSQAEAIELLEKEIKDLQQENQQLKKQKDDVVEYIKTTTYSDITGLEKHNITEFWFIKDLLRMLGEIDNE